MRPAKPSSRSVFAAQPPAWPAPTITIDCGGLTRWLTRRGSGRARAARLPAGIAVDPARARPLGEHLVRLLELARLPGPVELVLVGVVLGERPGGVLHVPEVGRRDRVAAGSDLGLPAAARDVQAAAELLGDVAHGERGVVHSPLWARRL